jgi:hypothetical protein
MMAGSGVGRTGVEQNPGLTLNIHNGHLTFFVTLVGKGESEVILQFYTLLLVWDVTPQV